MDIRIYNYATDLTPKQTDELDDFAYSGHVSELMDESPLLSSPATRVETLAGKIVKFILTAYGSDAFDPEYGSYLTMYTLISPLIAIRMRLDIKNDLLRCMRMIRQSEKELPPNTDRIATTALLELKYNPAIADRVDVYIRISTIQKQVAILKVPVELTSN